jgi:hypothetical protein
MRGTRRYSRGRLLLGPACLVQGDCLVIVRVSRTRIKPGMEQQAFALLKKRT